VPGTESATAADDQASWWRWIRRSVECQHGRSSTS